MKSEAARALDLTDTKSLLAVQGVGRESEAEGVRFHGRGVTKVAPACAMSAPDSGISISQAITSGVREAARVGSGKIQTSSPVPVFGVRFIRFVS